MDLNTANQVFKDLHDHLRDCSLPVLECPTCRKVFSDGKRPPRRFWTRGQAEAKKGDGDALP